MTIIESLLLAFALCVDSLVVSATSAFSSKMDYRRGVLMALIFAFFQGLFPLLGSVMGVAFKDAVASIDHWIAFGLLAAVGCKMVIDGIKGEQKDGRLDVRRVGVMCMLGIATSIDAFVVGIGLGLDWRIAEVLKTVLVIFVVTFLVSIVGVFLGRRNIPIPEKVSTIIAGLVLIGLGVYMLFE